MHGNRTEAATQRAVLALALDAHPKHLTIPDLARQIDEGDAAEVAVRDLVAVGLLECGGISVWPTVAAVHFDGLEL